jgi:hypothetical protein
MVVLGGGAVFHERGTPVASTPGSEESGYRVDDLVYTMQVWGTRFRAWNLGLGVWGLEFRVEDSGG